MALRLQLFKEGKGNTGLSALQDVLPRLLADVETEGAKKKGTQRSSTMEH